MRILPARLLETSRLKRGIETARDRTTEHHAAMMRVRSVIERRECSRQSHQGCKRYESPYACGFRLGLADVHYAPSLDYESEDWLTWLMGWRAGQQKRKENAQQ